MLWSLIFVLQLLLWCQNLQTQTHTLIIHNLASHQNYKLFIRKNITKRNLCSGLTHLGQIAIHFNNSLLEDLLRVFKGAYKCIGIWLRLSKRRTNTEWLMNSPNCITNIENSNERQVGTLTTLENLSKRFMVGPWALHFNLSAQASLSSFTLKAPPFIYKKEKKKNNNNQHMSCLSSKSNLSNSNCGVALSINTLWL